MEPVHLSSLPLTGCLDVSVCVELFCYSLRKEMNLGGEPHAWWETRAVFNQAALISAIMFVLGMQKLTDTGYWSRDISSLLLPLLLRLYFCIFIKEQFFYFFSCFSSTFPHKKCSSVWRECCLDACYPVVNFSASAL